MRKIDRIKRDLNKGKQVTVKIEDFGKLKNFTAIGYTKKYFVGASENNNPSWIPINSFIKNLKEHN